MASIDRGATKRVTFDEPLLVQVIEPEQEKYGPELNKSCSHPRKLVLWIFVTVFLGVLLTGSARKCGHHIHRHIKHKYIHIVSNPASAPVIDIETRLKPLKYTPYHLEHQAVKRADNATLCTTEKCLDFAKSIKSNLAPNYTAIDPCEDFSTYVCGGWRQTHDYRSDQASVSVGSIMSDVNRDLLHSILEGQYAENTTLSAANKSIDRENFEKMKAAYGACKDEDSIKKVGVAPVRALLDELETYYHASPPSGGANSGNEELTKALVWLAKNSVSAIVSAGVTADDRNPDTNIIFMGAGENGLPSKEYFNNTNTVANYTRAIAQMFQVIWTGQPISNDSIYQDPAQYMDIAKKIVDFEGKMARASPDADRAQEITYYYNPTTPAEIEKLVPEISITSFLNAQKPAGYEIKSIINGDPEFFHNISAIIKSTPREILHAYFQSRIIANWAGRLHKDYNRPQRVFSNIMAGRDSDAIGERWRTCVSEIDGNLGWLLSAAFVERAFSAEAKSLGDRIIRDIKAVFSERLNTFEWMSNSTKQVAAKKVVNIIQKVGYPTASPNVMSPPDLKKYYENVTVTNSYFSNGRSYHKYSSEKSWNDLAKPVDRARWGMTAPTVNAYYSPSGNEIVFPAGIMQLPVFGDELPEYVSYGAFGSVAGHELTHGFDNNGAHYDETGKYADWWDNTTLSNFNKKTKCFVDQYQAFTIPGLDGKPLHVNGKLTLGENIADAGGLTASFAAWQKRAKTSPNKLLPGLEQFSAEQMFFISYSNWWCGKVRPAQAVNYVYTDPHSPADKRIIGTLSNSKAFREAFQCKVKQPSCELW